MDSFITWQGQDILLAINVQPKAIKDELLITKNGELKIRITSPPTDNAANKHLIKFLAKQFGVTQAQITLIRGLHSKKKLLRINNPKKNPPQLQDYNEHKK
jgi:hypothetical protein